MILKFNQKKKSTSRYPHHYQSLTININNKNYKLINAVAAATSITIVTNTIQPQVNISPIFMPILRMMSWHQIKRTQVISFCTWFARNCILFSTLSLSLFSAMEEVVWECVWIWDNKLPHKSTKILYKMCYITCSLSIYHRFTWFFLFYWLLSSSIECSCCTSFYFTTFYYWIYSFLLAVSISLFHFIQVHLLSLNCN